MGARHLEWFEIEGFRAFERLRLDDLGSVNLICGRNSVGKSCLLDALQLYAARGSLNVAVAQLQARDELPEPLRVTDLDTQPSALADRIAALGSLFRGWPDAGASPSLKLSSQSGPLTCSLGWPANGQAPRGLPQDLGEAAQWLVRFPGTTQFGRLDTFFTSAIRPPQDYGLAYLPCAALAALVGDHQALKRAWDDVVLSDLEEAVLGALSLVASGVRKLNFRTLDSHRQVPFVSFVGAPRPVPLASLGEGLLHMLAIALSVTAARDGIVLLDEVAAGLHFRTQTAMWRMVADLAQRLNVQVFATTHSWDCIRGFGRALAGEPDSAVIRLDRVPNGMKAIRYDQGDLAVVVEEAVEVR